MPDPTTETAYTCESNLMWGPVKVRSSDGTDTYHVSWGRLLGDRSGFTFGWLCTCKGWAHRGTCRHTKEVEAKNRRCGWNAELFPTLDPYKNKDAELCCPECGAPAVPRKVAV